MGRVKLGRAAIQAVTIATDRPESDGTLAWDKTTIVIAEIPAGGERGVGYTYGDTATAELAHKLLAPLLEGRDAMDIAAAWEGMRRAIRNLGRPGIVSMAMAALGLMGEILPWHDNRVELAEETDRFGLRVAKVTFNLHENDQALIEFGKSKVMEIMAAAGASEVVQEPRYAHLVGAARMGNDAGESVVNRFGQAHDVPNLFICDGSILPTQGAANPGLTIQALAARTGDYLIREGSAVFSRGRLAGEEPGIRRDLSPPQTRGHGVPVLV